MNTTYRIENINLDDLYSDNLLLLHLAKISKDAIDIHLLHFLQNMSYLETREVWMHIYSCFVDLNYDN